MRKVKSIMRVAVIAVLLSVVSCDAANNPSVLIGRWIGVSGDDKGAVMELLSDGTGIVTEGSKGIPFTWKTENGRFYVTAFGQAKADDYKLQGSLLTFTDDKGKVSEYAKCKKDCQEAAKEYVKAKFAGVKKGSFSDSRDGKSYKTVKLDKQTWMSENLNYNASGSKCYDNSESNCQKYGRLYNWETATKACPGGWHLPSNEEWGILVDFAGGDKEAGNILKSSVVWAGEGNGIDAAGFSALPGGNGNSDGSFDDVGKRGRWWSATEIDASLACTRDVYYRSATVSRNGSGKAYLFSVRCVQD